MIKHSLATTLWIFSAASIMLLATSCKRHADPSRYVPASGFTSSLTIAADPSLEFITKQHAEVFSSLQDTIEVKTVFEDEAAMFEAFRDKKAGVMLMTRPLREAEIAQLKKEDNIYIREVHVARDAVALIGSLKFDDSRLDTNVLKKYFDVTKKDDKAPLLVFDNRNTSIVRHIFQWLNSENNPSSRVYALPTPEEVVDYVASHDNCIGFIPYELLSDEDEARVKEITARVKVLSLNAQNEEGKPVRVSANQSDILTGAYPFTRNLHAVIRYSHQYNPEWQFINYLFRQRGAKVFLKAGFVPAKMPERIINVNTGELPPVN